MCTIEKILQTIEDSNFRGLMPEFINLISRLSEKLALCSSADAIEIISQLIALALLKFDLGSMSSESKPIFKKEVLAILKFQLSQSVIVDYSLLRVIIEKWGVLVMSQSSRIQNFLRESSQQIYSHDSPNANWNVIQDLQILQIAAFKAFSNHANALSEKFNGLLSLILKDVSQNLKNLTEEKKEYSHFDKIFTADEIFSDFKLRILRSTVLDLNFVKLILSSGPNEALNINLKTVFYLLNLVLDNLDRFESISKSNSDMKHQLLQQILEILKVCLSLKSSFTFIHFHQNLQLVYKILLISQNLKSDSSVIGALQALPLLASSSQIINAKKLQEMLKVIQNSEKSAKRNFSSEQYANVCDTILESNFCLTLIRVISRHRWVTSTPTYKYSLVSKYLVCEKSSAVLKYCPFQTLQNLTFRILNASADFFCKI